MTVDSKEIDKFLVELLQNVGKSLRDDALKKKSVDTKKNRNDLVTNFDKKLNVILILNSKEFFLKLRLLVKKAMVT